MLPAKLYLVVCLLPWLRRGVVAGAPPVRKRQLRAVSVSSEVSTTPKARMMPHSPLDRRQWNASAPLAAAAALSSSVSGSSNSWTNPLIPGARQQGEYYAAAHAIFMGALHLRHFDQHPIAGCKHVCSYMNPTCTTYSYNHTHATTRPHMQHSGTCRWWLVTAARHLVAGRGWRSACRTARR